MTSAEALDLCEQVLAIAGGDADVTVAESTEALLRFANNEPIQHSVFTRLTVSLSLRLGQRFGQATVQAAGPADLARLVAQARQQAELLPPEPDLLPSVGPQTLASVSAFVPAAAPAAFDETARAEAAAALVAPAKAKGWTTAGIVSNESRQIARAASGGMRGTYAATELEIDLTVQAPDSTGRASAWARDPAAIDPAALGALAAERAARAAGPAAIEPGCYPVVLSAHAVGSLLWYLGGGFNARAVKEGRSWVADRRGQRVASERITLRQDVTHPLLQAQPFDGDGLAVAPVVMLRGGVIDALLYDRRTAAEDGAGPTGWSHGGRNAYGAGPSALVLEGGGASEAELLAAIGDGIYVERLWYTNWVDPKACVVTGMTRDGLYRVRGGRLAEPLLNLRFNQNLLALLAGVRAVGRVEALGHAAAPALAADGFALSSGTSF
jgi:predicted Zn-dependent protease